MWIKVIDEPLLCTCPLNIYWWFFKTVDSLYDSLKVGEVVISILILQIWKLSHFHRDGKLQVSGSKLCASCLCTSRLITLYPLPVGQTLHSHFPWTLEMVQCPISLSSDMTRAAKSWHSSPLWYCKILSHYQHFVRHERLCKSLQHSFLMCLVSWMSWWLHRMVNSQIMASSESCVRMSSRLKKKI